MYKLIRKYAEDSDLLRHNLIFFVGSLLIAVFNYLYYPVIGRLVSVSEFGEVQALISMFTQLGIVLTAFGYVITNITNNSSATDTYKKLIIALEQVVLFLCVVVFIAICLSSVFIQSSLKFTSIVPLVLLGILIILNVPATSRTYFLQGLKRLKEVSISGVIFAAGKLALSVALIYAGFSITGVVLGYIIAEVLTLVYLAVKSRDSFPTLVDSFRVDRKYFNKNRIIIKTELIYGLAVLVMLSGVTLLYTSDTIVIRLFFDSYDAGVYSGIAAVARIVFFVTASVAGVLIATVKMKSTYASNLKVLYKSFLLVSLIGGGVMLFFVLFPEFSISLLIGTDYASAASLLPVMALTLLVCSYNNLLISFEIALRRFKVVYILGFSVVLLSALLITFHGTLSQIVQCYLTANTVVCVLLSIQIIMRKRNV